MNNKILFRVLYLCICNLFSLLLFIGAGRGPAYADIVSLKDGSLINGKILRSTHRVVIFSNYYGTFRLRKVYIKHIQETKDFSEDVKIIQDMGRKADVAVIKRNFDTGTRKKREMKEKNEATESLHSRKDRAPLPMRCALASSYLVTTGKIKEIFPNGYGQFFALDLGLSRYFLKRQSFLFPSLRTEAGYLYYRNDFAQLTGISTMAGPLWLVPFVKRHNGRIHLSVTFGITYLNKIIGEDFQSSAYTPGLSSTLGYDYQFKNLFLFSHGRYVHVFGSGVSLAGIGMEFGAGYRFR